VPLKQNPPRLHRHRCPIVSGITPEHIDAIIKAEAYYVFPGTTVTVCCPTLRNGFHVIGESACVDPETFNEQKGRQIARDYAKQQAWKLEGYLLKETLLRT
jgi:hypothetical protein